MRISLPERIFLSLRLRYAPASGRKEAVCAPAYPALIPAFRVAELGNSLGYVMPGLRPCVKSNLVHRFTAAFFVQHLNP
jgi:hypothetical protein